MAGAFMIPLEAQGVCPFLGFLHDLRALVGDAVRRVVFVGSRRRSWKAVREFDGNAV
jgi:hypothetical protein